MQDTLAIARKQIHEFAVDGFKDHRVKLLRPGAWKCSRVGSWVYGFIVAELPGALVIYGDLGEAIFRPADTDVMPWLRGAVGSADYLVSKIQPQPEKEFYAGDAVEWARERARGDEDAFPLYAEAKLAEERNELNCSEEWCALVEEYDPNHDSDAYSVGQGPSATTLWLIEALRWFVAHESEASA